MVSQIRSVILAQELTLVVAVDGVKFNVKGKDSSSSSIGNKFAMSHEYALRANTPADALKWGEVIRQAAGQVTNDIPESSPTSPSDSRQVSSTLSPVDKEKEAYPETGTTGMTSAEREAAQAAQGVSATDKAY